MALSGIASSAASPRMVEYPHPGVPAHSWSLSEESPDPDPSSKIRLTVAVAQPKEGKAALRQEILKRSDPDSDLFSHWLTKKQVDDLIRPDPEAIAAVTEWLEGAGASDLEQTTAGDFIRYVQEEKRCSWRLETKKSKNRVALSVMLCFCFCRFKKRLYLLASHSTFWPPHALSYTCSTHTTVVS